MHRFRRQLALLLFAAIAFCVAVGPAAAAETDSVARHAQALLLEGRYAECYSWLRERHIEQRRDPLEHYLFAYAAYCALQLADVRAYARSAAAGGVDAPFPGWIPARSLTTGVEAVAPMLPAGGWVRAPDGTALFRVYAAPGVALSDQLTAAGPGAYRAAARIAFGDRADRLDLPPLSLFVFADDLDGAQFLRRLALEAPTDGSAVTVGLGLLFWERREGRQTWSAPYRAEATLAHETLHALQAMLGLQYGARWSIEGSALLAEDAVDPNHAIRTRAAALELLETTPDALERALDATGAGEFALYPAYYALAEALVGEHGLPTLGAAMRGINRRSGGSPEHALRQSCGLDRTDLVALCRHRMAGPAWDAARELRRLEREGAAVDAPAWEAAFRSWPGEPYLALLAARAALHAGKTEEARGIARSLEAQGYVGAREATVAQLLGRQTTDRERGGDGQ